jgi:hypothetical protein
LLKATDNESRHRYGNCHLSQVSRYRKIPPPPPSGGRYLLMPNGKRKKNREKVLQKKGRKVSKIKNKNKKGHMQKWEQSRKKGDGIVDVIMGI